MGQKDLPIWSVMDRILGTLRTQGRVIVKAPTGSGKTTQVPQAILDAGLAPYGVILVVQPRRIACRSAATTVAKERGSDIGVEVGYIVRHAREVTVGTKLCFVTDGVLMRLLERDPTLSGVDVVVFDEFHERRLLMDTALGLLREARKRRPELRLAVMSATLEIPRLAAYLDADVVEALGTVFPVEIRHACDFPPEWDVPRRAARVVAREMRADRAGHALVFLPGKEEIAATAQRLARFRIPEATVIPLHGDLRPEDQDRIFADLPGRKIILATNIAETSLTIPGVTLVVDSGLERRSSVDVDSGSMVLAVTRISRAAAAQRAGRAGRTAHGLCVRLWSQDEHRRLEEATPPEVQRLDIGSVILTLKSVGISHVAAFPFLDPPSMERLDASEALLRALGALDAEGCLTPIGWRMLRLPLPPRYARMVVEAERSRCLNEVASIAALMAGRPVFTRSRVTGPGMEPDLKAFATNNASDFFTLLEAFRQFGFRFGRPQWAKEHHLSFEALHDARLLRRKVLQVAFLRGSRWNRQPADDQAVVRSIASGLVDRLVRRTAEGRWILPDGLPASADAWSVVGSELAVAADVRLHAARDKETRRVSFLTAVDPELLTQLGVRPHAPAKPAFTHRPFAPEQRFAHLLPVAERLAKGE